VVIIAKNIFIDQSVTHVDAWLVTTGTDADGSGRLNTCTNGAAEITQPNANMCTNPLLVDGPVSANHLILSRTAGAGTGAAAGSPAEIFNLRADAYIWASAYAPGTGRLPTATMQELPPRF
jgi:hypothetical protein